MGDPANGRNWLKVDYENKSALPEVERHYYSQLTKEEIKAIYEKYKMDHELFGFTADYYIAMGMDERPEDEEEPSEEQEETLQ